MIQDNVYKPIRMNVAVSGYEQPRLSPGTGVTVDDEDDPNHGRDGYVRHRNSRSNTIGRDTYRVIFEPDVPDSIIKDDCLVPNGHNVEPEKLPPPVKP